MTSIPLTKEWRKTVQPITLDLFNDIEKFRLKDLRSRIGVHAKPFYKYGDKVIGTHPNFNQKLVTNLLVCMGTAWLEPMRKEFYGDNYELRELLGKCRGNENHSRYKDKLAEVNEELKGKKARYLQSWSRNQVRILKSTRILFDKKAKEYKKLGKGKEVNWLFYPYLAPDPITLRDTAIKPAKICYSGYVVLDVDFPTLADGTSSHHKNAEGANAFRRMIKHLKAIGHGGILSNAVVRGYGGIHVYFKLSDPNLKLRDTFEGNGSTNNIYGQKGLEWKGTHIMAPTVLKWCGDELGYLASEPVAIQQNGEAIVPMMCPPDLEEFLSIEAKQDLDYQEEKKTVDYACYKNMVKKDIELVQENFMVICEFKRPSYWEWWRIGRACHDLFDGDDRGLEIWKSLTVCYASEKDEKAEIAHAKRCWSEYKNGEHSYFSYIGKNKWREEVELHEEVPDWVWN